MILSRCLKWLTGFLILLSPVSYLNAQVEYKNHPWWVNLGAGPSLIGNTFSMNAGMVYCYQFEDSYISARMIGVTNKNPTVQKIDPTHVQYKYSDFSVLYGPLWQWGQTSLCLGGGLGLVRAAYEEPAEISTNTSICLPLEAQWFWRPAQFAGIGLYAYTSLNFEKHLFGVLFCLQLGAW
jgi:hypothetical protein